MLKNFCSQIVSLGIHISMIVTN